MPDVVPGAVHSGRGDWGAEGAGGGHVRGQALVQMRSDEGLAPGQEDGP